MPRKLLENASYDPVTVRTLCSAFDQAWGNIASRYHQPTVVAERREALAQAILDLASVGERDVIVLVQGSILAVDQSERPTALKR